MGLQIVNKPLTLLLHGISGVVVNEAFSATGVKLMNELWRMVGVLHLKNKGINHWIYDDALSMFTGVELEPTTVLIDGLEFREIIFAHYAYWKHVGPYAKLKDVHQSMERELSGTGLTLSYPRVEIYGHWTKDESALETEVLITLK